MTALRDAYPPVGVPVRLYRDGVPKGRYTMEMTGRWTRYYVWVKEENADYAADEERDAWEAV